MKLLTILEMVTGTPASFWNNLEANYQEQRSKLDERNRLENDLGWLKQIPTNELLERGYIEPVDTDVEVLRNVLCFYGVSSFHAWQRIWKSPEVAARRTPLF